MIDNPTVMNILNEIVSDLFQYRLWRASAGILRVKADGIPATDEALITLRLLIEAVAAAHESQYVIFESNVISPPTLTHHLDTIIVPDVVKKNLALLVVVTPEPRYATTGHYFRGRGLPIEFAETVEEAEAMIARLQVEQDQGNDSGHR